MNTSLKTSLVGFISVLVFGMIAVSAFGFIRALQQSLPSQGSNQYVIDGVNIVDVVSGEIAANKQVLISDNKILAINDHGAPVPKSFQRIHAGDAYITPGLIDMHTHIYDRSDLVHSLRYGVTTVRNLRGFPIHLQIKAEQERREWLGATLVTSSPVLDNKHGNLFQYPLETVADAVNAVEKFQRAGYDSLKVYNQIPPDILDALIKRADELDIPIVKHGPFASLELPDLGIAKLSKVQSVEHAEEILQSIANFDISSPNIPLTLNKLAEHQIYFTPTLATNDHLTQISIHKERAYKKEEVGKINPFFRQILKTHAVDRWLGSSAEVAEHNQAFLSNLMKITNMAFKAGVPILVGSDQGTMFMTAGLSTHREIELLHEAGLPAVDVLRAATINAAQALELNNEIGSIEVDKKASLVLTRTNPLNDLSTLKEPIGVLHQGVYLNQSDLQELSLTKHSGYLAGLKYFVSELFDRQ